MLSSTRSAAQDDHLDRVFHALGNRTRRALLERLTEGPAMVTELAEPFDMSLPAVGKHLRVLEQARLIQRTVDGRVHRCALNARPLRTAREWLTCYRQFWGESLDALVEYVRDDAQRR